MAELEEPVEQLWVLHSTTWALFRELSREAHREASTESARTNLADLASTLSELLCRAKQIEPTDVQEVHTHVIGLAHELMTSLPKPLLESCAFKDWLGGVKARLAPDWKGQN